MAWMLSRSYLICACCAASFVAVPASTLAQGAPSAVVEAEAHAFEPPRLLARDPSRTRPPLRPEGDDEGAGAGAARAQPAIELEPKAEGFPLPDVELLRHGTAPRERLRYAPTPGSVAEIEVETGLQMTGLAGEQLVDKPMPSTIVRFRLGPTLPTPEGHFVVPFHVVDASAAKREGVDPGVLDAAQKLSGALVGFHGWFRFDPRGRVRAGAYELPPTAPLAARQIFQRVQESLQHTLLVLPDAPVGLGARWEVRTDIGNAALPLKQVVTYTLRSVRGAQLEVRGEVVQTRDEGAARPGEEDAKIEGTVLAMSSKGTETRTLRLDALAPITFRSTLHTVIAVWRKSSLLRIGLDATVDARAVAPAAASADSGGGAPGGPAPAATPSATGRQ
ncbi:MAG: hypothetical protein KC543_14855 [Myxococcales bacterium]|nr:hypothetical protein [Myxococcales bacterium]